MAEQKKAGTIITYPSGPYRSVSAAMPEDGRFITSTSAGFLYASADGLVKFVEWNTEKN